MLQTKYCVVVPALDAHVENDVSQFCSIDEEASKIVMWLLENHHIDIYAVCGLSMGGAIAQLVVCDNRLHVHYLVMDGAPLVHTPIWLERGMEWQYIKLLRQLKKRKKSALKGFEKHFLPKCYMESFLKFADTMSEESVCYILKSVGQSLLKNNAQLSQCKILYLYGSMINEYLSKKSVRLIAKCYPHAKIIQLKGLSHAELAIYHPQKWLDVVSDFLGNKCAITTALLPLMGALLDGGISKMRRRNTGEEGEK